MTEPTRGTRARRGNRRPGSLLLTALLVLAIVASSALVFTNKVELLKLAVIVALWAAVVAAFVSFIYRRQADIDAAKSRDLKLVYDLQLDREISARREYELSLETHLRRELASELRAQTSDEVASLRAELAALRANLEIIFDTDLQSRPAIETERTTVHSLGSWGAVPQAAVPPERSERSAGPGRVISSRIDDEARDDYEPNTEESPIIDVPVEPPPPEDGSALQNPGGAHRRPSEPEPVDAGWRTPEPEPEPAPRPEGRRRAPEPGPKSEPTPTPKYEPTPTPEIRYPWIPPGSQPAPEPAKPPQTPPQRPVPEQPPAMPVPAAAGWRPVPAEGQYLPAGAPGSNWAAPPPQPEPPRSETPPPVDRPEPPAPPVVPAMTPPPTEGPRPGRHYTAETASSEAARRARHAAAAAADPGRPAPPPTLAAPEIPDPPSARHRGADEGEESGGQHVGGQPVSELMARLQVGSSGGGRRRRREE